MTEQSKVEQAVKAAGKEVAKEVVKEVGKEVGKEVARAVVQESRKPLAKWIKEDMNKCAAGVILIISCLIVAFGASRLLGLNLGAANGNFAPTQVPTIHAPMYQHPGNCSHDMEQWSDDLIRWEQEHGVPKRLLYSFMLQESGGNRCSISGPIKWRGEYVRAYGLFQLVEFHFADKSLVFDADEGARLASNRIKECARLTNSSMDKYEGVRNIAGCYLGRHVLVDGFTENPRGVKPHDEWPDGYKRYGGAVASIWFHKVK